MPLTFSYCYIAIAIIIAYFSRTISAGHKFYEWNGIYTRPPYALQLTAVFHVHGNPQLLARRSIAITREYWKVAGGFREGGVLTRDTKFDIKVHDVWRLLREIPLGSEFQLERVAVVGFYPAPRALPISIDNMDVSSQFREYVGVYPRP